MSEFKLPLELDGAGGIVDAIGSFVLNIIGRRLTLEDENKRLAFVALACNCHDDLLAMCEEFRDFLGQSSKYDWDNEITPRLEALIAKARKET